MTEKYHVLEEDEKYYSDIWDGYNPLINIEVVNLLNKQEEEINTLKSLIMDDEDKLRKLKKENGNLKFAYDLLTSHIDANYDEYMTQMRLHARIKELENELELYRHYIEFVPSSGDTE